MKKHITLAAASLLAASALSAQAQITLNGILSAAEIASTPTYNKYNSVGAFNTPHIANGGFGNWGLLRLYTANGGPTTASFISRWPARRRRMATASKCTLTCPI